ncbi:MAG: peptide chain release factor N(5)-glutamine methyltransferase [Vicinamibacterales bacterium]
MTLQDALAAARARLVAAGIAGDEARVDVDLFARTILGWDAAKLLSELRGSVPSGLEPRFTEWLDRRATHEPSAYIVGVREFWGLDLVVTPAVLIPRPCTELIVEEAVGLLTAHPDWRVAEIGTGSGCIAVSVAHSVPGVRIIATDLSGGALAVAGANAEQHGVADRIRFVETSYLDGLPGPFDLLLANPPYVKAGAKPALSRVVRHEPDVALFGGESGLRDIGGVLDAAEATLIRGGWLVMEFGYGQEEDVRTLVEARTGFSVVRVRDDIEGIARTAVVNRSEA